MAFWPFPSGYPTILDNFLVPQVDGVDIVWANHPNSLASALMAVQAKLNVDNEQVQNTGGLAFDPVGHVANPALPGIPSLWVDSTTAPGFAPIYTDEIGNDYDLRSGGCTPRGVYVDALYGSDATGNGSAGRPYETLSFAASLFVAPIDEADFRNPITFYLAPGTYAGPVTLPERMMVRIVGTDCTITGVIAWLLNPAWWDTFTIPTTELPHLQIIRENPTYGNEAGNTVALHAMGFRLEGGAILAYNSNTGTGLTVPEHILTLEGITRSSYTIFNAPSGTGVSTDVPGRMYLYLNDCDTDATVCPIGGGADFDGVGWTFLESNEIDIHAKHSTVSMYGTCAIRYLEDCDYEADYTLDVMGAPYEYGRVQGVTSAPAGSVANVVRSRQIKKFGSFMGFNPLATGIQYAACCAITFDRSSLTQLAGETVDMAASFYGFGSLGSLDTDNAYGRGWYFDESPADASTQKIPNAGPLGAYRLFSHTYAHAANFFPNSAALDTNNHLTLELESGTYLFEAALELSHSYVDIVGLGSGGNTDARQEGDVKFYLEGFELSWNAREASLQNVAIYQFADVAITNTCLLVKNEGVLSSFSHLSFFKTAASVGEVYAVMIDPLALAVRAYWEYCTTTLSGFLYGGSISSFGKCVKCSAGNYSFGGYKGPGALDISVDGTFQDCTAGQVSFGAVGGGGNVTISTGTFERCKVTSKGFGHSSGGGGVAYTVTLGAGATFIYCDNWLTGGLQSFGFSAYGEVQVGGSFDHCSAGISSFGSSTSVTGERASFVGVADNCYARDNSFGSSHGAGGGSGTCSGALTYCMAGDNSFGYSLSDAALAGGTFGHCTGGVYCFGSSDSTAGLTATFSAAATNCCASSYSFGASNGAGGGLATCSGTLTDCTSGSQSFGYAFDASSAADATFNRCAATGYSFGCTDSTTGGTAAFSGTAIDCTSDTCSFGCSTGVGGGAASCSGTLRDCRSIGYSFGYSKSDSVVSDGGFQRCIGGPYSFGSSDSTTGGTAEFSGSAVFCVAYPGKKAYSFGCTTGVGGGPATCSGVLVDCAAGEYSFGRSNDSSATASGSFYRCTGTGSNCFGSSSATVFVGTAGVFSGTAVQCVAGTASFGRAYLDASCSGTLTDCTASNLSYGSSHTGSATCSADFSRCAGGNTCFGSTTSVTGGTALFSGSAEDCTATQTSFGCSNGLGGGDATCSGTLDRCVSGDYSFGYSNEANAVASGVFRGCDAGAFCFGCSDSTTGGAAVFSGTAIGCTSVSGGGGYSFGCTTAAGGGGAGCSGTLTDCSSSAYSFGYSADSSAGATATFDRCSCTSFGFGCSVSATFVGVAGNFSGIARRCDCPGGYAFGSAVGESSCLGTITDTTSDDCSFGYSMSGNATAGATFTRCVGGDYSFGYTDAAAAVTGMFIGQATDCVGGTRSFGCGGVDGELGLCSGQLVHCEASYQSFGGTGTFSGGARSCRSLGGSFGNTLVYTYATLEDCKIDWIVDAAGLGPPGFFGALVRNCQFYVMDGEGIGAVFLNGGSGSTATKIYGCDLYSNTATYCIDTLGSAYMDAQIAHCRMNVDAPIWVNNLLGIPYNLVDASYNPYPDMPH